METNKRKVEALSEGIPKRPKRHIYPRQEIHSGNKSYVIPKHDAGYDDEEIDKWFKEVADHLEKLLKEKSFDHHIGHAGLLEGKYRVIGVEWIEKVLEALR